MLKLLSNDKNAYPSQRNISIKVQIYVTKYEQENLKASRMKPKKRVTARLTTVYMLRFKISLINLNKTGVFKPTQSKGKSQAIALLKDIWFMWFQL